MHARHHFLFARCGYPNPDDQLVRMDVIELSYYVVKTTFLVDNAGGCDPPLLPRRRRERADAIAASSTVNASVKENRCAGSPTASSQSPP